MQKPKKPTMTSVEAAALLLSGGATTDREQAELMNDGTALDPDALERAHFRRMMGFDFSILHDDKAHKVIIRDDELHISVTCPLIADYTQQAAKIAKACIKLKQLHDKRLMVVEGETVD